MWKLVPPNNGNDGNDCAYGIAGLLYQLFVEYYLKKQTLIRIDMYF